MSVFEIKEQFLFDGKPIKIYSGAVHYFRIVPAEWKETLMKLKLAGLNTVETYIPWNLHEPSEGHFDFTGIADIESFINLAAELGLYVIIRPSPYICAEWEFGGLPAWLLKYPGMQVRSNTPLFIDKLTAYYHKLFAVLSPLQITHHGPIIMMQVENEYGSFGNDKNYLRTVKNLMLDNDVDVPLFTADGSWLQALDSGSLIEDDVFVTANFGSHVKENFTVLQQYMTTHRKKWPLMCMEFWDGWFNRWGEKTITRSASSFANDLKMMVEMRANFNLYMFRGGTNFGFYNGASVRNETDLPQITSYDYDAPLTEAGRPRQKYFDLQATLVPKNKSIVNVTPNGKTTRSIGVKSKVALTEVLDDLAVCQISDHPLTMEELNSGYGFVYYRSIIKGYGHSEKVRLVGTGDYATIFLNQKRIATGYHESMNQELDVYLKEENELGILVENLGRVNYGAKILSDSQRKGIRTGVMVDRHFHYGWQQWAFDFNHIGQINWSKPECSELPSLNRFEFDVCEAVPAYLDCSQYGKGIILVNGFNIGRYWNVGPSNKLYLPSSLLKSENNEVIVFETTTKNIEQLKFIE